MTPERFAKGMTFDDYVKFTGSPENLGREGFDIRRFSLVRPRVDWSGFLRERHARARLTVEQTAAIRWLAAQPGFLETFDDLLHAIPVIPEQGFRVVIAYRHAGTSRHEDSRTGKKSAFL